MITWLKYFGGIALTMIWFGSVVALITFGASTSNWHWAVVGFVDFCAMLATARYLAERL